ncbi:lysophospholipid acyltransferase 7 isoform X2 [Ctenocephalides felis]|uniref:lysophospholipid acyltransferase 7 isoform X2 n=1 Tax=Ctenocephalides felis TaxID=7515 RepID=UPI000E6E4533|nr:lysophospholipid acyltransferase 7 isoform X2 [Ctenocephalides felis]
MNVDDIIYMSILFLCIGSGHYYRKYLNNIALKKWIGTACGFLIVFIVSGVHILHPLLSAIINNFIILFVDKRKCHLVSFTFMFLYLFFFRCTTWFGIPYPPAHTNLIQMILTLKLVGLAFEVNESHTQKLVAKKEQDHDSSEINPTFIEMFHYGFNYIGVLTGPYYSYKTFSDYLRLPYSKAADCMGETIKKLKWVPIFSILFLISENMWPVNYVTTDAFMDRSFLYRLCECVCTMAGLGAYPASTHPTPGGGPTVEYKGKMDIMSLKDEDMDFEVIHNIDPVKTDTCVTFREAMKTWNMCVQYWLAKNIYKRFPSKKYRTSATLMVSALWHGIYAGYYFCILGAPFYLPIEDLYENLFRKYSSGIARQLWNHLFWASKMFAFSYMGIAFLLLKVDLVWKYYSSVYHFGYILWIGLYLGGLLIQDQQKIRRNRNSSQIASEISKGISADSGAKIHTGIRESNKSNDFNEVQ